MDTYIYNIGEWVRWYGTWPKGNYQEDPVVFDLCREMNIRVRSARREENYIPRWLQEEEHMEMNRRLNQPRRTEEEEALIQRAQEADRVLTIQNNPWLAGFYARTGMEESPEDGELCNGGCILKRHSELNRGNDDIKLEHK